MKWMIFAIASLGVVLVGCSDKPPPQGFEMPAVPVNASAIEVRDVPLFFEAIGVVKPASTVEVKPQVLGLIKQVHFTEGEKVEEGALLYTLDEVPYAIRVREAEAQRDQTLVYLTTAQKKLARCKALTKQDLIAGIEWDEMESKIALHEAMLKADEARLAAAQLDLEHCKITAPMAGVVGKSALSAGSMAAAEPLVTLTQLEPLYVDFSITEKELQKVVTAAPAIKIYAAGKEECLAAGTVTFMDHAIDSKSGMLAVSGKLNGDHQVIWPGQSVSVRLYYDKKKDAQLIPMGAVRTSQDGPYIYTIKEDKTVEMRLIKLGAEDNGLVVVEEGLDGVGKVVTQGQHRLFPGSKIEEVER
jgi:membrane fusion protein, multidrug efflux system